jgi:hypothetical protein
MTLLALDWNATRVRAVLAEAGSHALPVPLEPPALELPLAISLEKATPEVGAVALRQCRSAAHWVCGAFLHHLTMQLGQGQRWQVGRHSLDAHGACELVWQKLNHLAASATGIMLTVPGYMQPFQANVLCRLGNRAPRPSGVVLGSVPTLLTAALAALTERFWQRSVLVIDADDHALTLGWVKALTDKAHLVESRSFTQLGVGFWKEHLLNRLSDLCVRQHRRDPRDAPQAEQSLYDQLEPLTDAALKRQAIELGVQGQQWFKHLQVHPEQTIGFCATLARQAAQEAERLLVCWPASELPRGIVMTHQASRLPGLVEAMQALTLPGPTAETKMPTSNDTNYHDDDFGEDLMFSDAESHGRVLVLPPEAPARAAHGLAEAFRKGAPGRHLETIIPLPAGHHKPHAPSGLNPMHKASR